MKFLIDNAVSPLIAEGLKNAKYDAIHIRDIGMAAASDPEIFQVAQKDDRIIVSADTDFGTLLAFRDTSTPSFILFRQTDKRPSSQRDLLLSNLKRLEKDLREGSIIVFEDDRIRIRSLPISKEK